MPGFMAFPARPADRAGAVRRCLAAAIGGVPRASPFRKHIGSGRDLFPEAEKRIR